MSNNGKFIQLCVEHPQESSAQTKEILSLQGSILSTKILRSETFSEKVRKFKTYHLFQRGQINYIVDVLVQLSK